MKGNLLYVGTTNATHEFHHGMTFNGRPPEDRWRKDADYSKLPYFPENKGVFDIGDLKDYDTYPELLKDPLIRRKKDINPNVRSPEVIVVNKTVKDPIKYLQNAVKKAVEAVLNQKSNIILSHYTPRTYQTIVAGEVVSRWNGRTITQPIKACPRFGKDYLHLDIFKRSEFRVMLIVGWILSANQGLGELVEERSQITNDITVIKPNYDEYIEALATGNRILIDVSLHQDDVKIDSRLLDELKNEDALIVVDEADFGAWRRKETLQKYTDCGNNLVLLSTGTNIERAIVNAGETQEIIDVSYLDLLELHNAGDATYSELVKTSSLSIEITDEIREEFALLSDENTPTMTKIFSGRNSHLHSLIIKQLFSDEHNGTDLFKLYANKPEYDELDHPAIQLFTSTQQKDVDLFCKKGRKVAPHLQWIALHSKNIIIVDGKKVKLSNRNAQANIQALINNSDKEGTVIVSCSMGSRSFSIPNIIAVVNAQDKGDLAVSQQRFSRCLTPGCDKKYGLMVDYCFDSNRISSFEKYLLASQLDKGSTYSDAIRRVYGLHQFLKKDKYGYLVKLTQDDCITKLNAPINVYDVANTKVDISGYIDYLNSILTAKKGSYPWKGRSLIEGAKNYIPTENTPKSSKEKKDSTAEKVCRAVIENAGNVYYLAPTTTEFEQGLKVIASNPNKDQEYKKLVGTSADVILNGLLPLKKPDGKRCFPLDLVQGIFERVSVSKDYNDKNFRSNSSSHVTGLFDFSKIKGNKVLYGVKEPDAAAMEELKYLSEIKDVTVLACQSGYLEFYKLMGYNTITKEEYFSMSKKDFYIISNYPFSDRSGNTSKSKDLDSKFVLKGQEVGVGGQEIMRTKHFTNLSSTFRRKRFSNSNIKSITRLDDSTFPTIQNTETCIIEWDADYNGTTKITYKDGIVIEKQLDKNTVIKLDNPDYIAEVDNNLAHRWVRGKLNRNKMIEGDSPIVEVIGTGETPVVTNIEGGLEETARNTYGVVINVAADWGSLGRVLIKPYEASISSSVMCLITDTKEESIQLQEYLLSDDIKKMVKLNMPSFHPTKDLFLKIPDPLL